MNSYPLAILCLLKHMRHLIQTLTQKFTTIFLLKKYTTAAFKYQWGMNLFKYQGIQLPGGVQFNGDQLMSTGKEEMDRIEETLQDKYELPANFWVG